MNPERKITELLEQSNAKLVRMGNHLVYDIPGHGPFTMSKTPSDHRSRLNEYSNLRHVLGLVGGKDMDEILEPASSLEEEGQKMGAGDPYPQVVVDVPEPSGIQQRIKGQIDILNADRDRLLAEAQDCEQKANRLVKLYDLVGDDPDIGETLESLVIGVRKPKAPRVQRERNPQQPAPKEGRGQVKEANYITSKVQITKHNVLAATQTYKDGEMFDTGDIFRRMIDPGTKFTGQEVTNIRQATGKCLAELAKEGKVICVKEVSGRGYSTFRKVDLTKLASRGSGV